ncbi:MAG: TolC family protein, partial [Chitinophagaceae bacterium]|nr:TolC family protein [Chitinophagaceae bacterium]
MKFLLLSILFYSIHADAFAQIVAKAHREAIALEEAIERGLQYSSQLQIDSINLKISYARIMQGKQQKLPDITANLSYFRISDNIIPFKVSLPAGEVVLNPQVLNQSFNSIQAKQLIWSGGKLRAANEILELEGKRLLYEISKSKTGLKAAITSIWYNLYALQHTQQILQS